MSTTRRTALIAAAALLFPAGRALAADRLEHGGFTIDMTGAPAKGRVALDAYLKQQIDLVNGLAIREEIKAWFRTVPLSMNTALRTEGRYGRGRIELKGEIKPPENPMLLHELLHAFHDLQLPDGFRNAEVRDFLGRARALRRWPERSYMLSNVIEFFAMTASVTLWGQAARPPSTRAELREAMPRYHDWLVERFGLTDG
jgi:hypothetical protein